MNKITYLDGSRLHRALVAGINNVISNQEYLNKINVFPVPDGDTGTNMAFTLSSILDSINNTLSVFFLSSCRYLLTTLHLKLLQELLLQPLYIMQHIFLLN